MNYSLYKGNPSNSGSCASFNVGKVKNKKDQWEAKLFVEICPQKTWNAGTKSATFDHENKVSVAISVNEAGDMIHTLETKIPFSAYHKTQAGSSQISFSCRDAKRKIGEVDHIISQFGFSINKNNTKYFVSINPGEAAVLKQLLEGYIKQALALDAKNREATYKKAQKKEEKEEVSSEEEEENDDIPF